MYHTCSKTFRLDKLSAQLSEVLCNLPRPPARRGLWVERCSAERAKDGGGARGQELDGEAGGGKYYRFSRAFSKRTTGVDLLPKKKFLKHVNLLNRWVAACSPLSPPAPR